MKLLKIIAGLLGSLVFVVLIGFVLLVTFVSPNRFKPYIINQVKTDTGRDLTVDGDLSWTFFPSLGVKIGHLTLNNPPQFKEKIFAEIKNATIAVKVMPLLHSKVESSGILVQGLNLNLITNEKGKTNWEDLHRSTPSTNSSTIAADSLSTTQKASLGLAISGIDVTNAKITWINEQTHERIDINHLDLQAKNITLTDAFPIQAKFNFIMPSQTMEGNVSLNSQIFIDLQRQIIHLNKSQLALSLKQANKKYNLTFKNDMTVDIVNKKIQLKNINGSIANLNFGGYMDIVNQGSLPVIKGQLSIFPLDVKKWLQMIGQDVPALEAMNNLRGNVEFRMNNSLKSLSLQSDMKIDAISAAKIHMTNIAMKGSMTNGTLNITPITAALYQGTLKGNAKIDLNATPKIGLQAKLSGVEAAPLLSDLGASQSRFKLTGTGNVDLQVTSAGVSSDAIIRNLNGKSQFSFVNGVLHGIDLGYWVDSAYALSNKAASPGNNTEETQFGTLNATAIIRKGIITNDDLIIHSPRFTTKGAGTINLVNHTLKYRLQTISEGQKTNITNGYGLPIPMTISGDLTNPSIRLDTDVLMKAVAKRQIEKVTTNVKQKIAERIKDKIPGKAGELLKNFLGQ